jgi:hypothetical protein
MLIDFDTDINQNNKTRTKASPGNVMFIERSGMRLSFLALRFQMCLLWQFSMMVVSMSIVTDLLKAFLGNGLVNTLQRAAMEDVSQWTNVITLC